MKLTWRVASVALLAVVLTAAIGLAGLDERRAAAASAGQPIERANPFDMETIAQRLVTESARVQEDEIVVIQGSPRDLELLESLAVNVRKVGAHPLVTLSTDGLLRRFYDDVPAKYDAQSPKATLALVEVMDVFINVDSNEDPTVLAGVPPERLAAQNAAFSAVSELSLRKGVRNVQVGNGLYPTDANARIYGLSKEALAELFWAGVSSDHSQLATRGDALKRILEKGDEVRLTNPNGTDLRFRIESRPVFVSDGAISAEDAKRGGAATTVWLPAGEVFLTPVPGTAEGRLVVDRDVFQGKEIRGVQLEFEGGKVTSMSAKSGLAPFKALYDAAGAGKDDFAYFDVGINPAMQAPSGSDMNAFMLDGMVTVGIGGNTWAGGDNDVQFGTAYYLPGSTVEVDGKVILEDGRLTV